MSRKWGAISGTRVLSRADIDPATVRSVLDDLTEEGVIERHSTNGKDRGACA